MGLAAALVASTALPAAADEGKPTRRRRRGAGRDRSAPPAGAPPSAPACRPQPPAGSAASEYTIFYGTASPPTSYGGYGGNAKEDAK